MTQNRRSNYLWIIERYPEARKGLQTFLQAFVDAREKDFEGRKNQPSFYKNKRKSKDV